MSGDGTDQRADPHNELAALRDLALRTGADAVVVAAIDDPLELTATLFDAMLTPGTDRYTLAEVADRAGVDPVAAQRLWRAMGFPDPPEGAAILGELDVEALRQATAQMLDASGIDNGVRQTRIYAAAVARITELWVDELRTTLDAGVDLPAAAEGALSMFDLERTTWLLGYVHRRLLSAGLRRELASRSAGMQSDRPVAFADLVGFTTLTERLGPIELSRLIESFEALAYDTVAVYGGRVVKTIGDEVLYTGEDTRTVLSISETLLEDASTLGLPDLRIGIDCGSAVWYEGDLYGPAVNRAARIVAEASPGSVVASRGFSDRSPERRWTPRGTFELKGIGPVELLELRRNGSVN